MRKFETSAGPVSAAFDGPEEADLLLVLAHGAGADMNSEFMTFMARAIAIEGVRVSRFNFVYSELGRRAPDRQTVLEDTYRDVITQLRGGAARLVIGGKSMGGRIASTIVASGAEVDGLVLLGYPLHPPGQPDRIRKAHLPTIEVPMLFVQGTRDPFCPLDTLGAIRGELTAPNEVVVIEDGDHSFKVRKSSGRSTKEAWSEVADRVGGWLRRTF